MIATTAEHDHWHAQIIASTTTTSLEATANSTGLIDCYRRARGDNYRYCQ
jgi:hypothetical protein